MGNYIRKTKKYSEVSDTNWSKEEDKILIENYKILGVKDISLMLNRSIGACRTRMYHLSKKRGKIIARSKNYFNKWTLQEDEFIKNNYAEKGALWCSKYLNRTEKACIHRAGFFKIKRNIYWKPEEDEIIRKYYPKYGTKKVSKLLGKSEQTCSVRANVLGIYYDNNKWTKEENDFIKKYYPLKGAQYVSNFLERSKIACYSRAVILNLKHPKFWSDEEIEFLKKYYPTKGSIWVAQKLNRPRSSCKAMASKLKIRFKSEKAWKLSEIETLKKYYPIVGKFVTEILINRSESACINQANRLGICYGKRESPAIEKIKIILKQKQVTYKEGVGFKECVDKKMLLFDIAIYADKNMESLIGIIEYDGAQHFFPTTLYQDKNISAQMVLKRTQRHDKIKNEFCLIHKIPMLRIKYSQRNFDELITSFLKDLKEYKQWYNPVISYSEYYNTLDNEIFKNHYIHFSKYRKNITCKEKRKPEYCFCKWTMEEDLYLEKYYPEKGSRWVSKYLHRTPNACANRAHKLGLYRSNRWKREEDIFLIKNYVKNGVKWCAKQLNRTRSSVTHRANDFLNIKNLANRWKQREDEYIIKYYSVKETKEIANDLNRTIQAIENRVRYLKKYKLDLFYGNEEAKVVTIPVQCALLIKHNKKIRFFLQNSNTNYRGEIYIHISQRKPSIKEKENMNKLKLPYQFKEGHIIAKCNLIDCKSIEKKELEILNKKYYKEIFNKKPNGKYKWIIKDFEILDKPICVKGKNGIWKYNLNKI